MSDEQAAAAALLLESRGHLKGPLGAWLHSPDVAVLAGRLGDFLRFRCSVPEDLKEIAILATATHWGAVFARQVHVDFALAAGVPPDAVQAIASGREPRLEGRQALVYRFASSLLESRQVADEIHDEVVAEFGKAMLVELVALCGYYSLVSLSLNAFRIESD